MKLLFSRLKIKKSSTLFAPLIAAIIAWVTPAAPAAVHVTQFDPPLTIQAGFGLSSDVLLNVLATDFNADGEVDFRLFHGMGQIEAYFNGPTRIAVRDFSTPGVPLSSMALSNEPMAAVPLNSRIGTNIVSPGTNIFAWSPGQTNTGDFTQSLGDHEATVCVADFGIPILPGPIITFFTNGTATTNFYYGGSLTIGEVQGHEAVMAVEFNISGEVHYGYIHFDFRNGAGGTVGGAGGVIYGWAYETDPNVAIKAKPLSTNRTRVHQKPPRIVAVPATIPESAAQ